MDTTNKYEELRTRLVHHLYQDYTDITFLAAGGFGVIFKSSIISTQEKVVLKMIDKLKTVHVTIDGTRIPKEVVLLKQCAHIEGVIQLHAFHPIANYWCLVIETFDYCCDLFDFISDFSPVPIEYVQYIFSAVCRITDDLAKMDIYHYDIKDENILLVWDVEEWKRMVHAAVVIKPVIFPKVKLIDFGNARLTTDTGKTFDPTLVYSPPEWISKQQMLPKPYAVWSLGVLLYNLLTSDIPFKTSKDTVNTPHTWLRKPKHNIYAYEQYKTLVNKCLEKSVDKRIHFDELMDSPLLLV